MPFWLLEQRAGSALRNSSPKNRPSAGRIAVIVCAMLVGAVFGPVAMALAGAAFAPERSNSGYVIEAAKLVEAYQSRLKPGLLFLTVEPPEDGAECGYKPEAVFPDGILALKSHSYTHYKGYFALDRWRNQSRDEAWIRAITWEIDSHFSAFEAGFLRRCIQGTLFANLCMKTVERFGDTTPRVNRLQKTGIPGEGTEDRVVCTFVDGVAARKGIALVPSPARSD